MPIKKRYLELLYHCALSDMKQEADRAYLGMLWWVLDPVIYLCMFYLIFEVILHRGGPGFIFFLLCGLVFFRWFDSSVRLSAGSIGKFKGIINQVYLPKYLLPMIAVTSNTMKFSLVFVLLLVFLTITGHPPEASWSALPLLLVVQLVLIVGAGLLLAALIPLLPDLMQLVNYGITMMFFMSGVFYDLGKVDQPLQSILYLNPMAVMISAWRAALLYETFPAWQDLAYVVGIAAVLGVIGAYLLHRFDLHYPRLVN